MKSWILGVIACAASAAGQGLPPGLLVETMATGFDQPTGFDLLPDGRVVVVERSTGAIKVVAGGQVATVGTISGLGTDGERGLMAVAVDPEWPARPYLYVHYSASSPASVVVAMLTVAGALADPASVSLLVTGEYRLLDDVPDAFPLHQGGKLRFGPGGHLFASFGDDLAACAAQDTDSLLGKIVRLDVSAMPLGGPGPPPKSLLAAAGNPFPGNDGQLVWAFGLRNPFAFDVDPTNGDLLIGDVGGSQREEVSVCDAPGQSFGWPLFEGSLPFAPACPSAAPSHVAPLAEVAHAAPSQAVVTFTRYRSSGGPAALGVAFEGDVLFVDFYGGTVMRLEDDGTGFLPPAVFATGLPSISDARLGPEGAIWFTRYEPGTLQRLRAGGLCPPAPGATPVLVPLSGDGEPGNAGWPLFAPVAVRVEDAVTGAPLGEVAVAFALAAGGGGFAPETVITGCDGVASTSFTLSAGDPTDPVIVASAPGAAPLAMNVVWRGLEASVAGGDLAVTVHHSERGAPYTLVAVAPPPGAPAGSTPVGDVWIDVLRPPAGLAVLDGLGIFGAPDPAWRTALAVPDAVVVVPAPPPLGVTVLLQAFSVDSNWIVPGSFAPQSLMISNPVTLGL